MNHEHFFLSGLQAPVVVRLDRWGGAHIQAQCERDLFFAQGFNAARAHLWTIDLARKNALGVLARDFGPGFLAQDYACRLLFGGARQPSAQPAARAPAPEIEAMRENFARGVNAFVAWTESAPDRLPPQFLELGARPDYWRASDVARLQAQADLKMALRDVLRAGDQLQNERNREAFCDSLPADGPSLSARDLLRLACAAPTLSPERLGASLEAAWRLTGTNASQEVVEGKYSEPLQTSEAPRAIIVPPALATTGRPIFFYAPFEFSHAPSSYCVQHLTSPRIDAAGAGEPFLPGLRAGCDGAVAFDGGPVGFTAEKIVFLEKTRDRLGYWTRRGERRFKIRRERFEIKGAAAAAVTLKISDAGPVLFENDALAIALGAFQPFDFQNGAGFRPALAQEASGWSARNCVGVNADGALIGAPHVLASSGDGDNEPEFDDLQPNGFAQKLQRQLRRGKISPLEGCLEEAEAKRLEDREHGAKKLLEKGETQKSETSEFLAPLAITALQNLQAHGYAGQAARLLRAWDGDPIADCPARAFFEVWTRGRLAPAIGSHAGAFADRLKAFLTVDDGDHAKILVETLDGAWRDCRRLLGPLFALWRLSDLESCEFCNDAANEQEPLIAAVNESPVSDHAASSTIDAKDALMNAPLRLAIDVGAWDGSFWIDASSQIGIAPFGPGEAAALYADSAIIADLTSCEMTLSPGAGDI